MNKNIGIVAVILAVLVGGFFVWESLQVAPVEEPLLALEVLPLAPEVEAVLADRRKLLEELVKDPAIIEVITRESAKNAKLSQEDIARLDSEWKNTQGTSFFVEQFTKNEGALRLKEFQVAYNDFKEIFVTDVHGLNVAQTNKTSDYIQSDEEWWVSTWNDGVGRAHRGEIEFDESAESEAVSLYIPIKDSGQMVGVLKAVLDLSYRPTTL